MPDPTDLTTLDAETLLGTYDGWVEAERLARHDGRPIRSGVPPLRAELLRRLRQWDALAMGPVDPPQEG